MVNFGFCFCPPADSLARGTSGWKQDLWVSCLYFIYKTQSEVQQVQPHLQMMGEFYLPNFCPSLSCEAESFRHGGRKVSA